MVVAMLDGTDGQLSFDFDGGGSEGVELSDVEPAQSRPYVSESDSSAVKVEAPILKPRDMRRAVLGWLLSKSPTGMALGVPTRVSKFKADLAAFWSKPNYRRIMRPEKTIIVEIRQGRGDCWPDCAGSAELLPLLRELKERKTALEAVIRKEEPELRDTDILFEEYATWRYSESSNKEYHACLRRLERTEKSLYSGSRFDKIRSAYVANELYLAAPEGTITPEELADGWGLLLVDANLSVREVKMPDKWDCSEKSQLHLIQNIASRCAGPVCFAQGVSLDRDGTPLFLPPPRKRRPRRRASNGGA